jgi:hypothetical protein
MVANHTGRGKRKNSEEVIGRVANHTGRGKRKNSEEVVGRVANHTGRGNSVRTWRKW